MTDHLINLRVDEAREWAGSGSFDCTDLAQAWEFSKDVERRINQALSSPDVSAEAKGRLGNVHNCLWYVGHDVWADNADPKDAARALTLAAVDAAEQLQGVPA